MRSCLQRLGYRRVDLIPLVLVVACVFRPAATCAADYPEAAPVVAPATVPVAAPTASSVLADLGAKARAAAIAGDYKALGDLAAANPDQVARITIDATSAVMPDKSKVVACVQALAAAVPSKAGLISNAAIQIVEPSPGGDRDTYSDYAGPMSVEPAPPPTPFNFPAEFFGKFRTIGTVLILGLLGLFLFMAPRVFRAKK